MITTNSTPWRRKFHAMEKRVPCHGERSSMPWRKHFEGTKVFLRSIIPPYLLTSFFLEEDFCLFGKKNY
jgi:hypothetical protein